jgi:hypothetical protein
MAYNSCGLGVTLSGSVPRGILCFYIPLRFPLESKGQTGSWATWQGLANVTIVSQIVVAFEWHKTYER